MNSRLSIAFFILLLALSSSHSAAQMSDVEAEDKLYKLTRSAPRKYIDGDKVGAVAEAKEILAMVPSHRRSWNYGNAVHAAHLVFGRIAADAGEIAEAKRRLFESVSSLPYTFELGNQQPWEEPFPKLPYKASPQMDSFGPDMSLALVLLKKGEKEAVLKYFDLCEKFWSMGGDRLERWRKSTQAGEIPDFEANLVYFFPKESSKEH